LENILGSPPPPPPANVPDLKTPDPSGAVLSMRERMEAHRSNPVCASCHSRMDPLGLALEAFDALGHSRTVDIGEGFDPESGAVRPAEKKGTAIDCAGTLPNGTRFNGPAGLREALTAQPDIFVRTMTEKLLVYAVGRGLDHYDQPSVRAITR